MLEMLKPNLNDFSKKTFCVFLFFLPLLFSLSLSAKVTCTGQACEVLPQKYITDFDKLDASFQSQYLQPVMQSMVEAAVISNNSSGMIGVGYVNRFQIGGGVGGGFVKKDDITVTYGDMSIPKMPNVGIAAAPTVMGAFNLGWILGNGPSLKPPKEKTVVKDEDGNEIESEEEEEEDEDKTFLHRFNFYFHGMKADYNTAEMKAAYGNKPELSGKIGSESFGVMMRYQLMEPKISSFDLIGFSGISLGVGYNMQNFTMNVSHQPRSNPTVSFGELKGSWIAKTDFDFASSVKSVPVEIRTGIKLLYFFDIYCGVGVSKNMGTADLHLYRGGPIKLSLDPTYVYNSSVITTDFYKNVPNSALNPEGSLSLDFRQKATISKTTNYAIVGMEINFLFLKAIAEATILDKAYGANVGIKIAF